MAVHRSRVHHASLTQHLVDAATGIAAGALLGLLGVLVTVWVRHP